MKFIDGYPVCENCLHSNLLYCKKYNKECVSIQIKNQRYEIPCEECLNLDSYTNAELMPKSKIPLKNAYFHIPDIYIFKDIENLLSLKEKYSDAFYEDRIIYEIYGAFNGCIWNGRTPLFSKPFLPIEKINDIKETIENLGLSVNLTWNNHLIEESDLSDRYCNMITELFHTGEHSITVSSDLLFNYLKEKYPNFSYYKSVIAAEGKDFIEDLNYDIQLFPRKYNNDWDYINKLSISNRNRIEFLCNDYCFPLCNRKIHYQNVNFCLLNGISENDCLKECPIDHDFSFYNINRWPMTIKPEDIPIYINNDFIHFKINGRGDSRNILLYNICKYLVKPQFFEDIYFSLLERGK